MALIAFVSVINHYQINGLHLFWDTLYYKKSDSCVQFKVMSFVWKKTSGWILDWLIFIDTGFDTRLFTKNPFHKFIILYIIVWYIIPSKQAIPLLFFLIVCTSFLSFLFFTYELRSLLMPMADLNN